jgi:3D (Asp-Asp-Asp) domain-containing protein
VDGDLMEDDMPDADDMTDGDGQGSFASDNSDAGDGLPGYPVEGWPGVRAGAFGSGDGLLGILRVKRSNKPVAYDPNATSCPGPYDTRTMEVTGYTSGPESTGKRLGDYGYGQGKYGPVGPGAMAGDPNAGLPQDTQVYVPGYGLGQIRDTGKLIKGDTLDLWFPTVGQARAWGLQNLDVEICKSPKSPPSAD